MGKFWEEGTLDLGTLKDEDLEILKYDEPPFIPKTSEGVVVAIESSDSFSGQDEKSEKVVKRGDISKEIRRLHKQGVKVADIAKELGIRYQHAYNVVKDYDRRRGIV